MENKLIFWIVYIIRPGMKIVIIKVKRMKYLQKPGAQRQILGPVFCNWLQTELQENLNLFNVFNDQIFYVATVQSIQFVYVSTSVLEN